MKTPYCCTAVGSYPRPPCVDCYNITTIVLFSLYTTVCTMCIMCSVQPETAQASHHTLFARDMARTGNDKRGRP